MFTRLQLKMTLFFSLILVTILLVTNFAVYIILINYNRHQLSTEVINLLTDIENQKWEHQDGYENIETKELNEPSSLNSFSMYIVYSEKEEIVNFKIDDRSLWPKLQEESKLIAASSSPQIIKVGTIKEYYYLVAKRPIVVNNQNLGSFFVGRNVTIAYETLDNLLLILIVSMILGSFISIVLGYFIAGKSIKPIKEAYETKQVFLANVSHELRTPLSVIMLSTNTLEVEIDPKELFIQEVVIDIKDEAKKMNDLIENLLLLSRSDTNKMLTSIEKVNLTELVEKEIDGFRPLVEQKKVQIVQELHKDVFIEGDKKLLVSVISILLDNAIKYSYEKGQISIKLHKEKARTKQLVHLSIKDNGIGIPEGEIKKIFDRFYRVENSRSKKTGGYGLGLSIAKEIMELHHGHIQVESVVDQGSEFILEFEQQE